MDENLFPIDFMGMGSYLGTCVCIYVNICKYM